MSKPLAIIGIGCLFPGAPDAPAFWASVATGRDSIRPVPATHWRAEDYLDPDPKSPDKVYSARGAFLDPVDFSPTEFGIPPNDLEATDASQLLGLVAARQALEDCGYSIGTGPRSVPRGRVGVILGVTGTLQLVIPLGARLGHPLWKKALREAGVDDATAADVCARIADGYVPWQENSFPGLLGNVVAGRIANRLDLGGTNCVVDAACASSLGAVHLAALELESGRADLVLTGGTDTFNDIFMFACFSKTPALSPTGDARPFDAAGDGTILGEGLGMVVLKRLDDARRDGDRVYAVLRGLGSSSDGKGGAIYAPRKEGQMEVLRTAYRAAGVSPDTVELVEAHGTGTRVGDATEASALDEVYSSTGRRGAWCAVGSVKSQIGHTKAAAGAAGLIKAALALHRKVLPPTIKVRKPVAELMQGPLYANTECRPWMPAAHPRRAAVSAFGFGGSNFHAVLEEEGTEPQGIAWVEDVPLVAGSGATREEAERNLGKRFDAGDPWRVAKAGGETFVGSGPPGKLGVLFPGQGAQATGMLRDLACHFPPAWKTFRDANESYPGLADLVYPRPAWDAEEKGRQEERLRDTRNAQPALGAVCLGAWRVLEEFGVRAEAFAGHSYGELVALAAAGRIDEPALHRLSKVRGELMASGDGAMLAVKASAERVRELAQGLPVILANLNSPEQTVLSGATQAISRAADLFARHKIPATRLPVAAAFHSPAVAHAERPLREALAGIGFSEGAAVYANTTAAPYPADADAARSLLAGQLARPVDWVGVLRAMHADGVRDFIECGPGTRLGGLVKATLPDAECCGVDGGFAGLARLMAWLAARGHAVRLDRWNPKKPEGKRSTGSVPLTGANHVRPRPPRPPKKRDEAPMAPPSVPRPADAGPLGDALAITRETLAALQRMHEQSAALHKQFLDGQDATARAMAQLVETQQRLLAGQPVGQATRPALPPAAPPPPAPPLPAFP
ncbi:MAG: acyltransferase domain-containing protein, partial [Gemmataceae bacterium]|nr:acyltransferase domain-containing protein [Gemmataceae bacterium]